MDPTKENIIIADIYIRFAERARAHSTYIEGLYEWIGLCGGLIPFF